jgi:hypothetical protein
VTLPTPGRVQMRWRVHAPSSPGRKTALPQASDLPIPKLQMRLSDLTQTYRPAMD